MQSEDLIVFMDKNPFLKYLKLLSIAIIFFWLFSFISNIYSENRKSKRFEGYSGKGKIISIVDGDSDLKIIKSDSETVGEVLLEQGMDIKEKDLVFPSLESSVYSGSRIVIQRTKKILILDNGEIIEREVFARDIHDALMESGVSVGEDDIIEPLPNSLIKEGSEIKITRVIIREETEIESIDFEKIAKEDEKLGWRVKKVTQEGKKGKKEVKYKVVYHNEKEVSRKELGSKVIEDPTPEITVKGTYVKLGKSHKGLGTWYAFKGGMFAANPWLPIGSYVKVTNTENGKSVIVQINDRGPFGEGRIIDLDKVAFQKIASLGAGVINVKMEEIKN